MSRVVTFGETMAVAVTDVGEPLRTSRQLRLSTAGAESTVAIGLSRLGVQVEWVGLVGDDELGARVLRDLAGERVGLNFARSVAGAPTGFMLRELATPELTRVTYYRSGSAGSQLAPTDIRPALSTRPDLVHLSGITAALSDSGAATVQAAVAEAREAGIPVSFDVNHRRTLPGAAASAALVRSLLSEVDVLFVGDDELGIVTAGTEPAAALQDLLARGVGEVVVKRGPDSALAATSDGERAEQPAWPVTVVDLVGAGDSFVAGYLAARLEGRALSERLRWATACAAATIGTAGDWEGLPTRVDIEQRRPGGETRR